MSTRSPLCALLVLAALLVTLSLAGCPSKPPPETTATPPMPTPTTPEPPTEPAAAPTEFTWTDQPAADQIPDTAVAGLINGKPFTAATVRIEKGDEGKCTLEISDQAVEDPTGVITGDTGVDLDFTLTEGQPGEAIRAIADEKDFDKEHAYYHYPQEDDKGPMSVNSPWGCALKIDEWSLEADPDNEDVIGKVTGKVAIVFDDDEKSWVAGTFEAAYYEW